MATRVFSFCLLAAAVLADRRGAQSGAFYFLLAAVPATGVGGLMTLGETADLRGLAGKILGVVRALLLFCVLGLAIVVAGSGSGPLLGVSILGVPALLGGIAVLALESVLGLAARLLRAPRCRLRLYARSGEAPGEEHEASSRRAKAA